jgi:hypothetical protein
MFASETVLGARMSANTAVGALGSLVDPKGLINQSESASTSFGAGLACTALGLVGTAQKFRTDVVSVNPDGFIPRVAARILLRVPWTLTTQAAGAAAKATIRADLLVNGVSVAHASGAGRALNAANGTPYVELITLLVPVASGTWEAGTTLEIQLQPEVTTISATPGDTYQPTLRHNPQVIGDQLVAEFTGFASVP